MSRRNKIVLVLMLLVGIGIFAYSLRNVKLSSLVHDIQTLRWEWLLVALACIIIYLLIEAVIVQLFMSERDDDFTFKDAIRVPLVEQLFNGLTPFSTGGQPAQLIAMMQSGVEAGQASSVLLMKFVIFQSMIVINFLISLVIGTIIGLIVSSILWWNDYIAKIFDPYLTIFNSLPKVALGPIIIIIAGANQKSIIVMALLISVIITIINMYQSFILTDDNKIKLLKSFKASKFQIYKYLILPNSLSNIISTIKINISMSLVGAMV